MWFLVVMGVEAVALEPAGAAVVAGIEARYTGAKGFSARFDQRSVTPYGEDRTSGTLELSRPSAFRWTFEDDGRVWVSNGTRMSIYDPVGRSVIVTPAPDLATSPALALLQSLDRLDELFVVRLVSTGASGSVLSLTPPRADGLVASVTLTVAPNFEVRVVTVKDAMGNVTDVNLSGIQLAAVPAARFDFVPPAGVTVLNQGME